MTFSYHVSSKMSQLTHRMYQSEDDYHRIRAFLREVFWLNERRDHSWQVARLDYWRFFINNNLETYALNDIIHLWENGDGSIVAALIPEEGEHVFLNVHPRYRTAELEHAMMEAAEAHPKPDTTRLTLWAHHNDELRHKVFLERGYVRGEWPEYQRARSLKLPIPDILPAEGYTIRALGTEEEHPARSWLSWRVFHPDEPDEKYGGYAWYRDVQRCPLYRRDLDLVAVAPDGELAAFCTVWFDDVTLTGCFEPVGTSPDHRQRGLGKAIMNEGLRRVKQLGATWATVAGYSEAANALYSSVMSPSYLLYERWHKDL